jgi:DNA polymerase-3 subunit beta
VKIEIEHAVFHEAVSRGAKALSARPATPILAGMLLRAAEGRLHASAFDFELAVQASAPASVGEPGVVLVSGRLLAEITRVLPRLPVTLTTEGNKLVLLCGAYRYTLACMPLAEYPELPEAPPTVGLVGAGAFAAAAGQAALAADRDDTLPFLTGARLEFGRERLRLVATDRYRLALREVPWQAAQAVTEPGGALTAEAMVPARTLVDAARLFEPAEQVEIGAGEGRLGLRAPGLEVTLRQLEGGFVRYAQLFPEEYAGGAVVAVAPLVEAVKAIALVAERNTPVRLEFTPGQVTVGAGSGDQAVATVTLEAEYDHEEPVTIAVNPAYLLDGLGSLDAPHAQLRYPAGTRPVVLAGLAEPGGEADPLYRYLFLPVRSAP